MSQVVQVTKHSGDREIKGRACVALASVDRTDGNWKIGRGLIRDNSKARLSIDAVWGRTAGLKDGERKPHTIL